MKVLQRIILIILILANGQTFAQNLEDIWISSHQMEIRKVKEREGLQDNEFITIKLDSIEIDTFYHEAYIIIDFISNNDIILKSIGGHQEKCTYSFKKEKLKIKTSQGKLTGRVSENQIVLRDKINNSITREIYFERIRPSQLTITKDLYDSAFYNTNWILETDTSSHNYGLNFHLLDSNVVIISRDYGEHGYTNWGEFRTDTYKNHFFLGFIDRMQMETKVYHFYDREMSSLIGNTYEHYHFATEPPPLKSIKLLKKDLLNNDQISLIESQLIGKWKAINHPIPFDTLFDYDALLNQKFEIEFKADKKFMLLKAETLVKDSVETQKEFILSGDWKLSETGKYIEIKPKDSWIRYLTLSKIEEDYLEIYYEIEALDERLISNETIKLRK